MIPDLYATRRANAIAMFWTKPHTLPLYYKISIACEDLLSGGVVSKHELTLGPREYECLLNDVSSNFSCKIIFKAVYNPASIDEGIVKVVHESPLSEFKYHHNIIIYTNIPIFTNYIEKMKIILTPKCVII